ncbi:MAG: NYN domain-containing protein, partial [Lachnospiraceae bacterium]|nr:NYN domain-containing protein [Lachnospiraceae bacterium]
IARRQVFPCYFGSALKLQGVQELLEGIRIFSLPGKYSDEFGARVFKITRDAQGNRLTHMKITGGTLHVRDVLTNRRTEKSERIQPEQPLSGRTTEQLWEEKVSQIRIFSGAGYEAVPEADAGTICAVTGLDHTYAGEGLGIEPEAEKPLLEPVLSYRIELPEGTDVHRAFRQLKQLEEEEPQLHITWQAGGLLSNSVLHSDDNSAAGTAGEIHAQLMGEVQTEILQKIILDRFGLKVRFGEGSIVYRETIAEPVVGMGHFEPLRHYAEVHLLLEPAERGSGLQFESICGADELDVNWQRLILTHLEEKRHPGVLTGSEITDMKITLIAGRAHQKHTEGGDFRQATYRAVRQGLCRAKSILLEPIYSFRLEVPMESVGRALSDIQRMHGSAELPVAAGSASGATALMLIEGTAPVVTMRGYQSEVLSYTKGRGCLFCRLKGYEECHNAQEVIEARAYDAQADIENPCGSVFCAHGAGFVVNWAEVPEYVHIADTDAYARKLSQQKSFSGEINADQDSVSARGEKADGGMSASGTVSSISVADDDELREIFERTYGTSKREQKRFPYGKKAGSRQDSGWAGYEASQFTQSGRSGGRDTAQARGTRYGKNAEPLEECLLVDGYNIIFAWDELKVLAKDNLESARGRLLDLMSNYQGYKQNHLIVVFDAYRVAGHSTEISRYHNIYVVYTKEAETADQYIEKTVREINHRYQVTVATSDALEQVIILGAGAARLSARGLHEEMVLMQKDLRENYLNRPQKGGKTYLLDGKEEIGDTIQNAEEENGQTKSDA